MLTAAQLFDLLKAKKMATHTGPRGGRYYVSSSGEKVYVGKEAGIRLAPGPVDESLEGEMHVRPERHVINWPTSRTVSKIAQERWPAYVCRSCHHPVVPKHESAVLTGVHSRTHGVGPAEIVENEEGELKAKPKKVGETVRVRVMDPSTGRIRTEYGWKPEWVASRLCDECFEKRAPAYEKRQERRAERKTEAHIEAGLQHHRQMILRKRESEKAEKKIKKEAERVAGRKKVKKSAGLWLVL